MVKTREKIMKEAKARENSYLLFERIIKIAIPLVVLLTAYIGYHIRMQTAATRYFIDPDTFYHYEIYRLVIQEWLPKYYALAEPPVGSTIGEPLGLYIIPAVFYKVVSLFGITELSAFRMFPPLVGFLSIIAIYLLGRRLHSEWAGLWSALILSFLVGHFVRTFSGNARGDGLFMMFFLFASATMFHYLDEKRSPLKYAYGALFIILAVLSLAAWNGSPFGIMVLLGFGALTAIVLFVFGKIEEFKEFVKLYYPAYLLVLILGYALVPSGVVKVGGHIRFALEAFTGLLALTAVMLYGGRYLNYSDKTHRLAVVSAIILLGLVGARLYVGPKIWGLMSGAYQSTQVYETVQELARTTMADVTRYYSVRGSDSIVFVLSLAGFGVGIIRFLYGLFRKEEVNGKVIFMLLFYGMSVYLMMTAVRFLFLASAAVALLAGYLIGEAFQAVLNMNDKPSTKALYTFLLVLLLVPMPVAGAMYLNSSAKAMARDSVTASWEEALNWLKNNTHEYDTATSWWDYGYWIESSLLSNRRASADGGHARDRDHILALFLAGDGVKSEVDFESWELNYFLAWNQDWAKFNAISYLGGAITRDERDTVSMIIPFQGSGNTFTNPYFGGMLRIEGNRVTVTLGNNQYEPIQTVDFTTGQLIQGEGTLPYVAYIFQNYAILTYYKIATSNFLKLAFGIPLSSEENFTEKLLSNFRLVHSTGDLNTYEFQPFGIYRIEVMENGTWNVVSKLKPGEYRAKLYISAFGRDVKDGKILLRAYREGNKVYEEVIADNVNVDHTNETPVEVVMNVPEADHYELVLIQKGPVGVLTGQPKLNGEPVSPVHVMSDGESGELELRAGFRRDYENLELTLRVTFIYLVRSAGESNDDPGAAFEPHMDIVHYEPIASGLSTENRAIYVKVSAHLPEVIGPYTQKLQEEHGDRLTIRGIRVEPIFIGEKEYTLWEG